ncbi:MAG TPA: hypothetical protein VFW33_04125 [Gemmataceae bacterium]|nr:hypothetical protein [Gemmataceae bacterium]
MDDHGLMLSVVATSRNDDHGANLQRRMQTFVNSFVAQCKRHDFAAELILVEWNPPADRPRLAQALRWPADTAPCQVRIIEVPEALHRRLAHADALPLYQMIAKNVGIRRARGRFVLATNIDILFSDELIACLKRGGLEEGKIYRIDRTDVETDVPVDAPVDQQLAYCRTHHLRLNTALGTFPMTPDGLPAMAADDVAEPGSGILLGGDVSSVEREGSGEAFRWAGGNVRLLVAAPPDRPRRLLLELSPGPCVRRLPAALEVVRGDKVVARGHILGRSLVALTLPVAPGMRGEFGLRAVEGGYFPPPAPDCRILDFAVHHLRWSEEGPGGLPVSPEAAFSVVAAGAALDRVRGTATGGDVVSAAAGISLDAGWHPVRHWGGLRFRWADSGACLVLGRGGAPGLRLWVGAGPNFREDRNTTLQTRGDGDRVLAEVPLRSGVQAVTLPLPAGSGAGRVSLHVLEHGGPPADGQGVRAFRLFSCAWSDANAGAHLAAAVRTGLTGLGLRGRAAVRSLQRLWHRRWLRQERLRSWQGGTPTRLPRVHTNACGDFTLMARRHWDELRGYSEFEIFSMHLDSLFLYAAHVGGLEEVVLEPPMRAYHIEHSAGSGWTPEGENRLFERIRKKGIPVMTMEELCELVGEMKEKSDPALFNRAGWGLADQELPETRVGRPGVPRAA